MRFNIFHKLLKSHQKEDTKSKINEKYRAGTTKDPILEAMQEKQPFEQAADTFNNMTSKRGMNQNVFFTTRDGKPQLARDIFGNTITNPDKSNPTRESEERPMDTIRSFEYSISGDPRWIPKKTTKKKNKENLRKASRNITTNSGSVRSVKDNGNCDGYKQVHHKRNNEKNDDSSSESLKFSLTGYMSYGSWGGLGGFDGLGGFGGDGGCGGNEGCGDDGGC